MSTRKIGGGLGRQNNKIDLHILIINAHSQGTWVPVPFDLVQLKKAS